ncbi:hypothetical protein CAPTEDRAFT_228195 [Capitella teleta]|uniref:Cilia- and flagella-associated protein 58 central coiled coil domain-containing protein n=1 Tax=Capitella teleta TaxID=283909 RepID=R7V803_CAPTE|nr:hypothetical protein CAPTEDRAFT_228195 [Capitella teleta]|eukprot:ELU12496.1 hypothetical protein CAPTEDRAFT_228195 [Capitella teleta]
MPFLLFHDNSFVHSLSEEKRMLEREYSRIPKEGEIEKKIEELKQVCSEMKKEITQRQTEVKNLREDLEARNYQVALQTKEFEKEVERRERLKSDLVAINTQPAQIGKESDRITRQKNETEKKLRELDNELNNLKNDIRSIAEKQTEVEEEKFGLDREVERQSAKVVDKETDYQILMKDFDIAKEREAVLMGDRATLDLNLRHISLEKKTTHDVHSRKVREKDRDLRNLKKADLQLKVAQDSVNHFQLIQEKVKGQVELNPRDDGTLMSRRTDLQKEVEQTKRALAQQNSLTAVETVKVEQSIAEEERLLYEQSDLRIEVVELTRLAAIKNDEREQKARDFMRAEMRFHRAIQDLKTKQLQIQDHQKKYLEMQVKLKDFAKLYDIIKNERNKCVNLIQTSTQKAAEMREKIKILQNEIEILRTAVSQKERLLQKQRLRHVSAIVVRDSLRNEVAKQQRIEDEMREQREQQRMGIAKLNLLINQAEEQMVQLRKQYDTAVQHRNDRGIQLIERNEEVCIFYEKVNIQEQMIRNGNVELQAREEEIRFLKLSLGEEKRTIELLKKSLPNKRNLEGELVTLQIQLSQCQDRMMEMEKELENPMDESRVRFLSGRDLTPTELHDKLEELEIRLAEKEESMLEKDLIFEQVCRLADRVKFKADSGKSDTLHLAKNVNEIQSRIKDQTRKMMAIVSELSMHQGNALRLQQEVKEKEAELEQCYMRMEKGEAPNDEIERDWQRHVRDEMRKMNEKNMARMVADEEDQYVLAGGTVTTADPRPNAYIPEDDTELPIPRPYGAHAPFKPNEPGSTMRHTRKPNPKPIEI